MVKTTSGGLVFDTRSCEFDDTPPPQRDRFTAQDVIELGFPLYPDANHYGVGYGELCAFSADSTQLAVLDADAGTWQ